MNHYEQNTLKGCAFMLGISVEELINVLHNASKIKEIRSANGQPFVLPNRVSQEELAPEIHRPHDTGSGDDSGAFKKPNYADAKECERAVTQLEHSVRYWSIEANYWHSMWLSQLADRWKTAK